jgi:ADP-heptose:LPS heptosyltransferase
VSGTLIARMGALGDVLLAGPCVRAVAVHVPPLPLLTRPWGRAAADLLPGVDRALARIEPEPPLPDVSALTGPPGYGAVHPGSSAPGRRLRAHRFAGSVRALTAAGYRTAHELTVRGRDDRGRRTGGIS